MPYRYLFLCVVLAMPAMAEKNFCFQCAPIHSSGNQVVLQDNIGIWGIYRQYQSLENCQRPADSGKSCLIDAKRTVTIFPRLETINVLPGITAEQANLAFNHKDSLVAATSKKAYGKLLWLTNLQATSGVIYYIEEGVKMIIPVKNETGKDLGLARDILFSLLAIVFFGAFCALALKQEFKNSRFSVAGFSFLFSVLAILMIETKTLIKGDAPQLILELVAANLGFALFFFLFTGNKVRTQIKKFILPKRRFLAVGPIRDSVLLLGFFTVAELVIFVGLQTQILLAFLSYLGIAIFPFLIFYAIPAWKHRLKTRPKKPRAATK